jgi:hypothetical protein
MRGSSGARRPRRLGQDRATVCAGGRSESGALDSRDVKTQFESRSAGSSDSSWWSLRRSRAQALCDVAVIFPLHMHLPPWPTRSFACLGSGEARSCARSGWRRGSRMARGRQEHAARRGVAGRKPRSPPAAGTARSGVVRHGDWDVTRRKSRVAELAELILAPACRTAFDQGTIGASARREFSHSS